MATIDVRVSDAGERPTSQTLQLLAKLRPLPLRVWTVPMVRLGVLGKRAADGCCHRISSCLRRGLWKWLSSWTGTAYLSSAVVQFEPVDKFAENHDSDIIFENSQLASREFV